MINLRIHFDSWLTYLDYDKINLTTCGKEKEEKTDSLANKLISSIEMSTDFMLINQGTEFISQDKLD